MDQQADPPVVGIGASAGGIRALQEFFGTLPSDTGAAFVVILHLAPERRSELAGILASRTAMPVAQIEKTVQLEGDHVYVIAPDRRLRIADHMISTLPFDEPRGQRAPIDLFFRSLAAEHIDAFAIVMTGAGADGAIGVKAVKASGGIVLVQDPMEAEYASMPRSAIATESADFVLPVRDLAARLVELLRNRGQGVPTELHGGDEEYLRRIIAHVRVRTGHDFSQYKQSTVLRRVTRRLQVCGKESLEEYYHYLRENAGEAQLLFSDFLISVTTFFRDPKAFVSLAEHVIPHLLEDRDAGGTVRVWVPGCATGEEAYTVAILLLEEAAQRDTQLQVFGSDLDPGALAIAREGRYPATIEADLSEERLRRHFIREGEHYRVRRELRDVVLFADHSLLRDPPFSRLDLISCRNLLIYLDRNLQQQVCNTFHYALRPGGFLFLGSSEMGDQPPGLFRVVDRDARIYRTTETQRRPPLSLLLQTRSPAERPSALDPVALPSRVDAALHRQMLERIAPPSVLVDETHRAVHLSDSAGRYMQPSGGPLSADISDLVRPELRFDLRAALNRAFERGETVVSMPIPVRFNGAPHRIYLNVKPTAKEGDPARYAMVMFIEGGVVEAEFGENGGSPDRQGQTNEQIRQLQDALQLAQTRLAAMREEAEGANEELRAANEELQSINEEYRSTSEELETSKEELQSTNEELQTVNNELKIKLESISQAHNDLQNLMAATDVGTLFLDTKLRIKRFTPQLTQLFSITASDEGRPITDFTHQLDYDQLADNARTVLRDLTPVGHEVQSRDGVWYLVRMRPYRTVDNQIDGVVVTFVDITERRRSEEALREGEMRLQQEIQLVDLSHSPIMVWDFDDGILRWNRGSEELYGFPPEEALGRKREILLQTVVPGASFAELRQSLLDNGTWSGELVDTAQDGRSQTVESQIELAAVDGRRLVLESTRDITEERQGQQRQKLLLGELSHRVKNTLAVVQSLARRSLQATGAGDGFAERFEGRLLALSAAHNLLVDSNWAGAELGALARSQIEPYATPERGRVRLRDERVNLPAFLATPFGLVLHELATNAAKYGAFATDTGSVTVSWTVAATAEGERLTLLWQEQDGPPVEPPERLGFGSTLIEHGLPGAAVQKEFRPEGVVCTIEINLSDTGEIG